VYTEQDEIDGFHFMTKGLASFNLPEMTNMIYAVIDPQKTLKLTSMQMDTFQFFGLEDSVHNHILMNRKEDHGYSSNINEKGENLLNKRVFQVCCIKDSECLQLDMASIDKMKRDFMSVAIKFYRRMIDQYVVISAYKKHCSGIFKEQWYSPDKKGNFSRSITNRKNVTHYMKNQAFMLQECSNQIN